MNYSVDFDILLLQGYIKLNTRIPGNNLDMNLRNSTIFICLTTVNTLLFGLIYSHALMQQKTAMHAQGDNRELVKKLRLTDLCLFTEARYTRHPSMADNHAAFQEHPAGLDHFPSGSMILPVKSSVRAHAEKP